MLLQAHGHGQAQAHGQPALVLLQVPRQALVLVPVIKFVRSHALIGTLVQDVPQIAKDILPSVFCIQGGSPWGYVQTTRTDLDGHSVAMGKANQA